MAHNFLAGRRTIQLPRQKQELSAFYCHSSFATVMLLFISKSFLEKKTTLVLENIEKLDIVHFIRIRPFWTSVVPYLI